MLWRFSVSQPVSAVHWTLIHSYVYFSIKKLVREHSRQVKTHFNFLNQVRNGEQKSYILKDKDLTGPTKGVIYLEIDVIYNTVSIDEMFSRD